MTTNNDNDKQPTEAERLDKLIKCENFIVDMFRHYNAPLSALKDLRDMLDCYRGLATAHGSLCTIEKVNKKTPERVCLSFDELKPGWAQQAGYDVECVRLGMKDLNLSGDFDTKETWIYGTVDDYEIFKAKVENSTVLSEGKLCKVDPSPLKAKVTRCLKCHVPRALADFSDIGCEHEWE